MMISLDIVNLFINIPIDLAIDIIENKLKGDNNFENETSLPIVEVIRMIKFCMSNITFKYNSELYIQKSGAPMGSNPSTIIAEAVVSSIFEKAYDTFDNKPKFLRYYVDDSFIIINKRFAEKFIEHIKTVANTFKTIKFTVEYEENNKIPFLDVLVQNVENKIKTNKYKKPTHSDRYLDFRSHHSLQNKKSVVKTLAYRLIKLTSNSCEHDLELANLREILHMNNYPYPLINKAFEETINSIENKNENVDKPNEFDINKAIVMPYYQGLSEHIRRILSEHDIRVVFRKGFTLMNSISPKLICKLDKSDVVYSINCMDCNSC